MMIPRYSWYIVTMWHVVFVWQLGHYEYDYMTHAHGTIWHIVFMTHYDRGTCRVHGTVWPFDVHVTQWPHDIWHIWHITVSYAVTGHSGRGECSTEGAGDSQWRWGHGHVERWWHGPQRWHVDRQSQGRAFQGRAGRGRQIAAHTGQVWLDSGQHRVRSMWRCNWQCLFGIGSTLASYSDNFGWRNIPIGTHIYCLERRCLAAHIVDHNWFFCLSAANFGLHKHVSAANFGLHKHVDVQLQQCLCVSVDLALADFFSSWGETRYFPVQLVHLWPNLRIRCGVYDTASEAVCHVMLYTL